MRRYMCFALLATVLVSPPGFLGAQAASTFAPQTVTQRDTSTLAPEEIALPLGAAAGLASKAENAGKAAAIVGLQVWQQDVKLFNAFFNFAGSTTVKGSRNAFGDALLNPSVEGMSFTSTVNYVIHPKPKERKSYRAVFGELALAFTTWQPDTTKPGVSGFIVTFTPGVEFATRTMSGEGDNSYQAGVDMGPTFRMLGGNLAQGSASSFRADTTVLGVKKTFFAGLAVTGWLRLNSVQPFVRVTHFGGEEIPGFSGLQAFIGVKALSPIFSTPTR